MVPSIAHSASHFSEVCDIVWEMAEPNFSGFQKSLHAREIINNAARLGGKPSVVRNVGVVVLGLIAIGLCFLVIAGIVSNPDNTGALLLLLFLIVTPTFLGGLAVRQSLKNAARALRLKAFAEANGFTFTPAKPAAGYPGALFSLGRDQLFLTAVNGTYQDHVFEFGNFYCTVGSGKSSRIRSFGVIEITLPRKLPHVLLDSLRNNAFGASHLTLLFNNEQQLQLEGNFNSYFTLYVPKGYERDALYFLTPELMSLLIDQGADFDVEMVDNHLYIYAAREFDLQYEHVLRQIFELIATLGGEVRENTARYADARVGDRKANQVAEPGKRLEQVSPILATVVILFFCFVIGWLVWWQVGK